MSLAPSSGSPGNRGVYPSKAEPVVILGYTFWQNQLGSNPDIVGKTLRGGR
jgi:hypothetical protein